MQRQVMFGLIMRKAYLKEPMCEVGQQDISNQQELIMRWASHHFFLKSLFVKR